MKTWSIIKLIIPSIFIIFCSINGSSSANSCSNPMSCPYSSNRISGVRDNNVSVHYPFRLKYLQPISCGKPGFDLYCDDTLGTLIRLPNNAVLPVNNIYYSTQELHLSNPYDRPCLPQILMSLNLTDIPFRPISSSKSFWLYNCSDYHEHDEYLRYDRIDCLSGLNYSVISAEHDIIEVVGSNCSFLNVLRVPTYDTRFNLTSIPNIALTWSGPSDGDRRAYYNPKSFPISPMGMIFALIGTVIALLTILCCCCRRQLRRNNQQSSPNNRTRRVAGLNQVTIDSYPVVVVGESGHLDDTTCPICLSDYCPGETLKILPECLHRFHAECIDQWLRSKGVCPICRASTPLTTSSH